LASASSSAAAAECPELRHEAERRVAGVGPRHQAVAALAGAVLDLLRVGHEVGPGRGRRLGVEARLGEQLGVPDQRHGLVVGRHAVDLGVIGHGLHGAGPELGRRVADVLGLELEQLALGGELDAPQDRQARDHRCGVADRGGPYLVEQLVVVDVLRGQLDVRIGRLEGLEELRVDLVLEPRRGLVGPDIPIGQAAAIVARHDAVAFGGGVDLDRAGDAADIVGRPALRVDALRDRVAGTAEPRDRDAGRPGGEDIAAAETATLEAARRALT